MSTKIEINISRLLHRMEEMGKDSEEVLDWRFDKYLIALRGMLSELQSKECVSTPSPEVLQAFTQRIEALGKLQEALRETDLVTRSRVLAHTVSVVTKSPLSSEITAPEEPITDPNLNASNLYSSKTDRINGPHQDYLHSQKSAVNVDMRRALLGEETKPGEDGLSGQDSSAVVHRQRETQNDILEHMLSVTRNMKSISLASREVILGDLTTIDKTVKIADKNTSQLAIHNEKLKKHLAAACNWLPWIALAFVMLTFVFMVVFMRIFSKN